MLFYFVKCINRVVFVRVFLTLGPSRTAVYGPTHQHRRAPQREVAREVPKSLKSKDPGHRRRRLLQSPLNPDPLPLLPTPKHLPHLPPPPPLLQILPLNLQKNLHRPILPPPNLRPHISPFLRHPRRHLQKIQVCRVETLQKGYDRSV